MKRILVLSIFGICLSVIAAAQTAPSANEILQQAYQQAAKENKNVFIMFHASWCGWCHKMDKSINDPVCKKFFDDNYVIAHLVVDESKDKIALENAGAAEFRAKYHGNGVGIPFWLVFSKDGKLLSDSKMRTAGQTASEGSNTGCPANAEEVAFFIDVLKKTTQLNAEQLEIIRKRFRENEE